MRTIIAFILLSYLTTTSLKGQILKTENDTTSYSLGVLIGNSLKSQGFTDINPELFAMALNTVLKGETPLITSTIEIREGSRPNT